MSKFFKALEQADRERALREQAARPPEPAAPEVGQDEPPAPAAEPVLRVPVAPAVAPVTPTVAERRGPQSVAPPVIERPVPAVARPVPVEERPAPPVIERPAVHSRPAPPPLAEAPVMVAEPPSGADGHLVSLLSPASLEAEQYRALRHLVEQFHRTQRLGVVAISSPAAGDGKTTTAINLAGALAQDPAARVLLIDADLRASSVLERLGRGRSPHRGLVDAILDPTVRLEHVARPCPPFTMFVLPAGRRPGAPYELLTSPRFGELLTEARRQFDYILLDTPPLVLFPDCRVLGGFVDGFLMVVAAHKTPRKLVEEALGVIDAQKLLGLVFNGDERSLSPYYYGYAYGYRPQPDEASSNGHRDGRLRRLWGWPAARGRRNPGRHRA
jgi:capsular exopolysaccharide synthesis family protein